MSRIFVCDTCYSITGVLRKGKCPDCNVGTMHPFDVLPTDGSRFKTILLAVKEYVGDKTALLHYFEEFINNSFLEHHQKELTEFFRLKKYSATEIFKADLLKLNKPETDELLHDIGSVFNELDFSEFVSTANLVEGIIKSIFNKINSFKTWDQLKNRMLTENEDHIVLCAHCQSVYPYLGYTFCALCGNDSIEQFHKELKLDCLGKTEILHYLYPKTKLSSPAVYVEEISQRLFDFYDIGILGPPRISEIRDELKRNFVRLKNREVTYSVYLSFIRHFKASTIIELKTAFRALERSITEIVFSFLADSGLEVVRRSASEYEIKEVQKSLFSGVLMADTSCQKELRFLELCMSQAVDNILNGTNELVDLQMFQLIDGTPRPINTFYIDNHRYNLSEHIFLLEPGLKRVSELAKVIAIAYFTLKHVNPGPGAFATLPDLVKKICEDRVISAFVEDDPVSLFMPGSAKGDQNLV